MRRRKRETPSSLDLFLDTICNAFGGIVFISILIAVLAQMQSKEMQAMEGPTITKAQSIVYQKQIEQRQRELTKVKQQLQILEKQTPTPEQEEQKRLMEQIVNAQKFLDELIKKQLDDAKKLSQTQSRIADLRQEAKEVDRKLLEAKAEMQKRSMGADDALNAKISKVSVPNVTVSKKGNMLLAMRYGKLYLVSDPSSSSPLDFYTDHVDVLDSPAEKRIKPKSSSGWDLSNPSDVERFKQVLQQRSHDKTFLSVAVWPDSFKAFRKFRETVIPLSFEYQLVPLDDVANLPVRKGNASAVQ
jgi:hypothetical protein